MEIVHDVLSRFGPPAPTPSLGLSEVLWPLRTRSGTLIPLKRSSSFLLPPVPCGGPVGGVGLILELHPFTDPVHPYRPLDPRADAPSRVLLFRPRLGEQVFNS